MNEERGGDVKEEIKRAIELRKKSELKQSNRLLMKLVRKFSNDPYVNFNVHGVLMC